MTLSTSKAAHCSIISSRATLPPYACTTRSALLADFFRGALAQDLLASERVLLSEPNDGIENDGNENLLKKDELFIADRSPGMRAALQI